MSGLETLVDGLTFPEGPRWHDGRLWFSDFYSHRVLAVDETGDRQTMAEVQQQPSGLGWLPDGRLLVVSMLDRRLLRQEPGGELAVHADLSALAPCHCNDMVVDGRGHAWVGNFGFDRHRGDQPTTTCLIHVSPSGEARTVADQLFFPNGTVIVDQETSDGHPTLVVAESRGQRLTAFSIAEDGSLGGRRIWADLTVGSSGNSADLDGGVPDGICLDREGAIWVADPRANEVFRVHEGGRVSERISTGSRGAYACVLGGEDGRTLYVCTNTTSGPTAAKERAGRIETIRVDVPTGGSP